MLVQTMLSIAGLDLLPAPRIVDSKNLLRVWTKHGTVFISSLGAAD